MFEYKEFELLAQLYVERQDDTPETKAIMDRVRNSEGFRRAAERGVDMDDLTAGVYSAVDAFQKIAFIAGMTAGEDAPAAHHPALPNGYAGRIRSYFPAHCGRDDADPIRPHDLRTCAAHVLAQHA